MTWITRFIRRYGLALLALFVALGGTTYAATGFPANVIGAQQLQRGAVTTPKIRNNAVIGAKVANDSLTGADVPESSLGEVPAAARADRATTATSATNATNANHATTADSATSATNATNATNATSATTARTATTAANATNAANAANVNQFGGAPASVFQRRVQGICTNGVRQVADNGPVVCSSVIDSFALSLAEGNEFFFEAGPPGFPVSFQALCDFPATDPHTLIAFRSPLAAATLNWFYSNGTMLFVGGEVLPGGSSRNFGFGNARIQGQYIYAQGTDVATVKVHAVDGVTSCELRGTVVYASSA